MKTMIAACLAFGLAAAAPAVAAPAVADCARPNDSAARMAQTLAQINTYRSSAGLPALTTNAKLTSAAAAHACDLVKMRKLSHRGSNGLDLSDRVKAQGYRYLMVNENIADTTPSHPVAPLWYNSPGHRRNMLEPGITDVGLALVSGAGNRQFWVMVGGRAR